MTPAEVEEQRQFKKTVESLAAEIAQVDAQALHHGEKIREITLKERRRVWKLQRELNK